MYHNQTAKNMKTSNELISLRMEITQGLNEKTSGILSDNIKVMNLKHSYGLLMDVYKMIYQSK